MYVIVSILFIIFARVLYQRALVNSDKFYRVSSAKVGIFFNKFPIYIRSKNYISVILLAICSLFLSVGELRAAGVVQSDSLRSSALLDSLRSRSPQLDSLLSLSNRDLSSLDSISIPTSDILDRVGQLPSSDSLDVELGDNLTINLDDEQERAPFLDAPIFMDFTDSLIYVPSAKDVFLHKEGKVTYGEMELSSDFMSMNTQTKLIHATGVVIDSTTMQTTDVNFIDGGTTYDMDSMSYNMDSGKAMIHGPRTQEGEGYLSGGKVKKMKDNVMHMHGGRYTTCDAECPHFYLQMTKATVVPGEVTVFGPAYMVFEDVPLYPLTVPFGFFPQKKEQSSGIIIPQIGEEVVKGFYLRDMGYYFAINDYVDLKLMASIYTLGSWGFSAASNYALRYKFSGNFDLSFDQDIIGEPDSPDYVNNQGFAIRWSHRQDAKFSPGSTFSASVNFTSNSSYNKYNADNLEDVLSSQTSSTIAYSKNWAGTPFSLSANASLSQNSRDSTVTLGLPNVTFNVTRISPFKRKNPVGGEKWYEKISFTYNMNLQNRVNSLSQDKLFQQEMWDKMQTGIKHTIPVSASFNVGGVFSITPGFNYNERWYFKRYDQSWNPTTETVDVDTTSGFYRVYDYNLSLSLNTKVYGTYTVGSAEKPAIFRHVMTPNVSLSFAPDFGDPQFGFWKTVQTSAEGATREYSPYSSGVFGTASSSPSASLSFGLQNTLEAKVPSDEDTTGFKKIKLIEGFSINSSYNFLADSLNLSPFSVSVRIPVVTGYTLQANATFDPYALDANNNRINTFLVEQGKFLRMTSFSFNAGYGFKSPSSASNASASRGNVPAINDPTNNNNGMKFNEQMDDGFFAGQSEQEEALLSAMDRAYMTAGEYYDFNIPWSLNLNYSFSFRDNGPGRVSRTQTINASGSINLTEKWGLSMSAGYDFEMSELTPGTIQVTRDLHCWQMSFSWVPVGFRQSWSFTIQAKSSMLADLLKWDKNNSFLDNYYN